MLTKINVKKVEFGRYSKIRIAHLFQYDKGQILQFEDVPDGTEVQFSNNEADTINKKVTNSQVEIPDILLQENSQIFAYVKIINEDSETTVKVVQIPVKARARPGDYVSPDDEQTFREWMEQTLNDTKEIAQSVRNDADESIKLNENAYKQIQKNTSGIKVLGENVNELIDISADGIACSAAGENICIKDASDKKIVSGKLFGKSTQLTTTGVQLWSGGDIIMPRILSNSGYAVAPEEFKQAILALTNGTYTYSVESVSSGDSKGNFCGKIAFQKVDDSLALTATNTFELTDALKAETDKIVIYGNAGENIKYENIMLNAGSKPLPYEPYTEGQASPSPKYPQAIKSTGDSGEISLNVQVAYDEIPYEPYKEAHSLVITTPDGLHGIPVSSGGNYTDEHGQQWISDTIEKYADGTGKRIQRIYKTTFTKEKTFRISIALKDYRFNTQLPFKHEDTTKRYPVLCNKGVYAEKGNAYGRCFINSNQFYFTVGANSGIETIDDFKEYVVGEDGIVMYCPLPEPIETPLTAEEMAELEKLHTYKPITNITTDCDAGIEVEYVADTKKYIDNKFTELQEAILSTGGNV